ncbi:MAG TPA: MFS transporter, partial [Tepidisphaeraceae bacterium]
MTSGSKATRIQFFDFSTPQMRAFHMSWFAFLMCFFAWFGLAPFMPAIRSEFHLTPGQIGNLTIASVAITVLARLTAGWLCDRIGPRLTYSGLLILGSAPVMAVGLAHNYHTFLLFRLAIGAIGASFVITQYHTSSMFAPNVVGTANAITAGWGNMGGGVTQFVMPLIFGGFVALGLSAAGSWRLSMLIAGAICLIVGVMYFFLTQDTPEGNFKELNRQPGRRSGMPPWKSFVAACGDARVWMLFVIYAACFGVELVIDNVGHLYFTDYFHLGFKAAGWTTASFGMLNLFARALGGYVGDRVGVRDGLKGRVSWLFAVIFVEGLLLMAFSRMTSIGPAVVALMAFGLFVQMGCGATFAVVPFVRKEGLGAVSGIVGAGGNVGAVAAGFLFKGGMPWPTALLWLGAVVTACSVLA